MYTLITPGNMAKKGTKLGRKHLYDGAGGHYSVMSELLCRGWNVAVPTVDVGDDVFVIKDKARQFLPVQVKTANGKSNTKGYSTLYKLRVSQLTVSTTPDLVYVFAARVNNRWGGFVTIGRYDLEVLYSNGKFGTLNKKGDYLHLTFSYVNGTVKCSGIDLTKYLDTWSQFPVIPDP